MHGRLVRHQAVLQMPKLMIVSMKYKGTTIDKAASIRTIVGMAEKARREGLLALEDETADARRPVHQKGISLVVDGTDPELVKDILESDLDAMEARHAAGRPVHEMGGFAPTLGIIGTVMGLVHVLENLSNPARSAPPSRPRSSRRSTAWPRRTSYYLPIGNKLKKISHEEVHARTMIIEGIVSIQAGDNPRVVEEKLKTFLDPAERAADERGEQGGADGLPRQPAPGRLHGQRKKHHAAEHPDERWLLTYADMITLLMALFMVLYAMSMVNKTKFETLGSRSSSRSPARS